jgi:hypothetical protein
MWRCSGSGGVGLLVAAALLGGQGAAQEPSSLGGAQPKAKQAADTGPGESIFNDQLRRFKFLLEHEVATTETAEEFLIRYRRPENPPIIGAYPDAQTNALVVIGPPEAEQAIRECLAQRIADGLGIVGAPPLPMQLRLLQHQRTELLELMADLEVQEVGAASEENGPAKASQLADRRKIFEAELRIVEQQIRVVRKYMARVEADESAPDAAVARE